MSHRRYGWYTRENDFLTLGKDGDMLEMFDRDIALKHNNAILFFNVWGGGLEPKQVTDYKNFLNKRKIQFLQLPGRELTDAALAEARFLKDLRGV